MSVYVGPSLYRFGRMVMCHMASEDIDELVSMAIAIGVNKKWLQNYPKKPHFDISKSKRRLAVQLGAIESHERKILSIIKACAEREKTSN